jgi:hypothetical protein
VSSINDDTPDGMIADTRFSPLCIEEFDLSDKNFRPCPCGYQVCTKAPDRLFSACLPRLDMSILLQFVKDYV